MKLIAQFIVILSLALTFSVTAKSAEKCEFSSHAYQALDATDRVNSNFCSDAAIDATLPSCPGYKSKHQARKRAKSGKGTR